MSAENFEHQYTDAFEKLARAGAALWRARTGTMPMLSHICFKFSSPYIYENYVSEAEHLGPVTRRHHNGREISWCHLRQPLQAGMLKLEWIELVHPAHDPHDSSGVACIGYHVPGLAERIKIPSADPDIEFRYQALSAAEMAL